MEKATQDSTFLILNMFLTLSTLLLLTACSSNIPPPSLSGPWKAGSTTFEISDSNKWVQIRAWFPTNQESDKKMLSSDKHTLTAFAKMIGLPKFLLGNEESSRSNINVDIAKGQFPVIIFNHGLMSYARQNTTQFEQLASHGYVVLSLANPSNSMVVVRQNGDVVTADENSPAFKALEQQKEGAKQLAPKLQSDIKQAKAATNFNDFSNSMATLANNPVFKPMASIFDAVYENNKLLLSSMKSIQNGEIKSTLAGHLDLSNIGAYGHSFGSIMSGILAMGDHGIKAAFGMDAPQLNLMREHYKPFQVPVCYVYADTLKYAGEVLDTHYINHPLLKTKGSCEAVFKKSAHYNFSDLNLVTPLRYSPMLGKVDNNLMAHNIEALLLAFFDEHLKGKETLTSITLSEVEIRIY